MTGPRSDPAAASSEPQFYSVSQVARLLGMSSMTVYRAINGGEFPAVRIRGRLIVPAEAVRSMVHTALAEQTVVDAAGWVPEHAKPSLLHRAAKGA